MPDLRDGSQRAESLLPRPAAVEVGVERRRIDRPCVLVQRQHPARAASLGVEGIEPVPGADVEDGLSLHVGQSQRFELDGETVPQGHLLRLAAQALGLVGSLRVPAGHPLLPILFPPLHEAEATSIDRTESSPAEGTSLADGESPGLTEAEALLDADLARGERGATGPVRRLVRRLVLRLMGPFTNHQRALDRALLAELRRLKDELRRLEAEVRGADSTPRARVGEASTSLRARVE